MIALEQKVSELLGIAIDYHRHGYLLNAEQAYRQVLECSPNHANTLHLLGVVSYRIGKLEAGINLINRAIKLIPLSSIFHNNLGNALQISGKLEEAIASYQQALELNPNYSEAHNNLGNALQISGKLEEAIASYQQALELKPRYLSALKSLGEVFLKLEKFDDSIFCYEKILAANPEDLGTANNLGIAFLCKNLYKHAQEIFNYILFKKRGIPESNMARFDTNFCVDNETEMGQLYASPFKLQDRIDQLNYLIKGKKIDSSFQYLVNRYLCLLQELNAQVNRVPYTPLTQNQKASFAGYYDKIIYYADAPHISGATLNESLNWNSIEDKYIASSVVYFDDLLTPAALEGLRNFCLESTVFFRDSEAGFVGSYMAEGFSCSLIYQIISELKLRLPRLLNGLPLNNMWIYRYGSRGSGVKTHTGDGSVTLNFWITPDEANLNQNGGSGLVIYDKEQPLDWDWLKYNMYKDDPQIQARIGEFLESANSLVIPYRCNRAVLFQSNLFHRSDPFYFHDSFENRRMNITMLFGRRGKESADLK
ncbi:MAG TPA: tetratricopeptide repeat protein [Nostoc sp.]|uniref:tetratricopeptide repeat protein n=1 Tax=Nostoc sp. TaxID=1180 RepID=UPI002D5F826E|nr:tetratricopeptide repeat protein [Nostoc sp.]HYX16794.1 tetratricopeptide repeat protein [Nostoc sp.]